MFFKRESVTPLITGNVSGKYTKVIQMIIGIVSNRNENDSKSYFNSSHKSILLFTAIFYLKKLSSLME